MSYCKIHFENPRGQYGPGDKIDGRVECFFDEPTKIRGIEVRLSCKEHNDWMETHSHYNSSTKKTTTRRVKYSGDNVIFRMVQTLYAATAGSDSVVLPYGRHVFPFEYTLPRDIPSSFNGPYGYIGFRLKAVVDRPWKFDYEDVININVFSPIDIRSFPSDDLHRNNFTDNKTVCCWCCAGGDLTLDVDMPFMAFIPGQTVDFRVRVINLSNVSMDKLKIKLTKTLTYMVDSPSRKSREDDEELLRLVEHGVGAHGEHIYELAMQIPSHIEVPNFSKCRYFESTYHFQVSAEMDGCTFDLDIDMYPKMGHMGVIPQNEPHVIDRPPQPGFVPDFRPPPYPIDAPFPGSSNPNAPPPSYAGATEKGVYPPGPPTAPASSASAPPLSASASAPLAAADDDEDMEVIEQPPPTYGDVQKINPPYPPQ